MSPRTGTWNVQYAKGEVKNRPRREVLDTHDADVWVLTETNDAPHLSDAYEAVHSAARYLPEARGRWVTVWTRLSVVARHETADPVRTVAVTLTGADGPVCMFGTVLPWLQGKGPDAANLEVARAQRVGYLEPTDAAR